MGVTVNGTGSGGGTSYPAMSGMLTIRENNQFKSQVAYTSRKSKSSTTKKKLNYNYRDVSGQLLRAKKVQGASNALSRAKSKLSMLRRCAASGQYDTKEVAAAIAHARRMVECAQLKIRNLKTEEMEQRKNRNENSAEERQQKGEVKRRVAAKERELREKMAIDEIQKVQQEKTKRQQMIQQRRRHRNQEQGKINEADMKYLKQQAENYRCENSGSTMINSDVILNLSAEASRLSEAQIKFQAEQAAAMEMEAVSDMAGMTGADIAAPVQTTVQGTSSSGTEGAAPAAVDISV